MSSGLGVLDKDYTAIRDAKTWRLVQQDSGGEVLWVSPVGYGDQRLALRAAKTLNQKRSNPGRFWVVAPEGMPT